VKFGIALGVVALLVPLSVAWGTPRTVPPGASGANQYTETLPGPGGDEPTSGHSGDQHGGEARDPAQVLGKSSAAKLEGLGPEGVAAARLATESAPAKSARDRNGTNGGQGKSSTGTGRSESGSTSSGSSAIGQVVGQLSGSSSSGGMGLLLPVLIAMTVVGAAGYLVGRHRLPAQPRD
jgi:hypothetical protein